MASFSVNWSDASANLKSSEAYLAAKEQEAGVVKTASGLLYKVLNKGNSTVKPTTRDTVKVHYAGTLVDGKEFDSSYKRGTPTSFGVTQVIPGWTEALQLMSIGDTIEVYIHPKLAYGARGAGGAIPGNSAIAFKVELIDVPTQKREL